MKELLNVWVEDDGSLFITTDFDGWETRLLQRHPLYPTLVSELRNSPDCMGAIRLLEIARREARLVYQGLHPELTKELLIWRRNKANAKQYPAYLILNQRVLYGIADQMPVTREALLALPGFGPGLYDRYGEEILQITQKYQSEHPLI